MVNIRNQFHALIILFVAIFQTLPADDAGCRRCVDISVDAIYWYASQGTDWAYILTDEEAFSQSFQTFTFDWTPGFRVGVGYELPYDRWDTQVHYTWFQSKATDHVTGTVISGFLPARLSLLEPFSTGKASLQIDYNIFDWELGRSFFVCNHLNLRPFIGVKGGWIHQTIHSSWTKPIIGPFDISAAEALHNQFYGAGPKGGFSGVWSFGNKRCLSVVGMFEAGYLWGHWSIRDKYVDNLATTIYLITSDRNYGAFMVHSLIGLGWDCRLNDRCHLDLTLGYEMEDWFNQFQIYSDIAGSQNNNLILQGFTLRARVDF